MFAAPTMIKGLIDEARRSGRDGKGIRTIVYGGGPMYVADIIDAVDVFGDRFVQIYGQGESPMTITALPRRAVADRASENWRDRLASVGRAHSCVDVRIVDAVLEPVEIGTSGEILVRGATVMRGYWRNALATGETIVDGWLRTGDVGKLDEVGYLTLPDRLKDVIISGGSNIYPREVEEVLALYPKVREVAVVGFPNAKWGEEVVAFVVAADVPLTAGELDDWCRERIAAFKRPRRYFFPGELPKNNYGKVLKTRLRATGDGK